MCLWQLIAGKIKNKRRRTALRVTEYSLRVKDPANRPVRPVRIALLADLHDCVAGRDPGELPAAVDRYCPDLVICAGDMLTAKAGINRMEGAMKLLRHLSGRYPVYLADGNHESRLRRYPEIYPGRYRAYVLGLQDMGAVLLNNRTRIVETAGMKIAIHGFVQDLAGYSRVHPGTVTVQDLERAIGSPDDCGPHTYHLLIAHMPDHFAAYSAWGADLTVSGHVHGGIVRLPLLGGVFGSSFKPFPKYDRGLFRKSGPESAGKTAPGRILTKRQTGRAAKAWTGRAAASWTGRAAETWTGRAAASWTGRDAKTRDGRAPETWKARAAKTHRQKGAGEAREAARDRCMIVSAGLGSHTLALRVNNPPELVLITLA